MKERNKRKIIFIGLAILIPIIGIIAAMVYLKLTHKKDK